ncbi:site-specific integrase [Lichenihabitans sp. Uapishka_5]|uniref:site-specific integrase n=1 Tax=Lichenihabitans sp. Uapishka_5 TaxID=3037302 RepID=UPI0029E811FC|nr:site-specific integrase [Lichenihabitans sp. Uapishka_5]MDX7953362.1 site-specific integrase [Lichenihabitans sp. Uapishka_5]
MTSAVLASLGEAYVRPGAQIELGLASAKNYARAEKSDATQRAYASDFSAFRAWCESVNAVALPADQATVAAYLASLADAGLKVSTITRRAAAISFAHKAHGHDSPTAQKAVKSVMRGIRRSIGTAVDAKAPATAKTITAMLKRAPGTLAGKRDRALLLIGFAAALRRSELVALNVADIERQPEGIIIRIRKSKTDQEGSGHEVAIPRGSKLRPVEALDAWLSAAGITEGPLFRPVNKGDRLQPGRLEDRAVARIVKRYAIGAKLDPSAFSGHSLRAGFVTSALETGADLLKVMAQTRHRSVETVRKYDRRARIWQDHAGKGFL